MAYCPFRNIDDFEQWICTDSIDDVKAKSIIAKKKIRLVAGMALMPDGKVGLITEARYRFAAPVSELMLSCGGNS